ncbi:MAG: OmpA family protein [Micavibrio sp.]
MRPFLSLIMCAVAVMTLSACETAEPAKVEVSQPVSEAKLKQVYDDMMANTEGGSVQVFPLEPISSETALIGMPSSSSSVTVIPQDQSLTPIDTSAIPYPVLPKPVASGKLYSGDSNVMVFPLDTAEPLYKKGGIPPMVAPVTPAGPTTLMPGPAANLSNDGVDRIYFDHGVTGLSPTAKQVTDAISTRCKTGICGLVKVEGHASVRAEAKDEVQRRIINLKVSMDRAMNVSRQLIKSGVPADAIQVTAHGDRIPPQPVAGADVEAAARRVEVITNTVSSNVPYTN